MSIRAHRVNKLEYDTNATLAALKYGSPVRGYLQEKQILQTSEGWDYQFEIDVEALTAFVDNYKKLCKSDKELTTEIQKEILELGLLNTFRAEIAWAENKKDNYILYHEF